MKEITRDTPVIYWAGQAKPGTREYVSSKVVFVCAIFLDQTFNNEIIWL